MDPIFLLVCNVDIDYGPDTAPFTMYNVPRLADSQRLPIKKPFSMQGDDMPVLRYRLASKSAS